MGIQTYKIELKCRVTDEQHAALSSITMQYARNMIASAMLIAPDQQPQAVCQTQDAFYDTTEIDLIEPLGEILTPE